MIQHREEFDALLEVYKKLKPKKVLEIGVHYGGTLWYWMRYAVPGATIIAVDDCAQKNSVAEMEDHAKDFDIDFHFIVGDSHSQQVIDQVNSYGPFDFAFIDGDHYYEGVKKDWEAYGKNSSVVAFHDIVPHDTEVNNGPSELWQELKNDYKTKEFVKDWHGNFAGIGVIYKDVLQ